MKSPVAVLISAATVAACAPSATMPPSAPSPLLGKSLPRVEGPPPVSGPRIEGVALTGRPVVVEFFAEYCEPCKRSLPAVERASKDHPEVTFIGVSEDEYAATAQALAARYGLTFSVVHDASGSLRGRFRVSALPATFVADRTGLVRWVSGVSETETDLSRVLDVLR